MHNISDNSPDTCPFSHTQIAKETIRAYRFPFRKVRNIFISGMQHLTSKGHEITHFMDALKKRFIQPVDKMTRSEVGQTQTLNHQRQNEVTQPSPNDITPFINTPYQPQRHLEETFDEKTTEPAPMTSTDIHISNTTELLDALKSPKEYKTIVLNPGHYKLHESIIIPPGITVKSATDNDCLTKRNDVKLTFAAGKTITLNQASTLCNLIIHGQSRTPQSREPLITVKGNGCQIQYCSVRAYNGATAVHVPKKATLALHDSIVSGNPMDDGYALVRLNGRMMMSRSTLQMKIGEHQQTLPSGLVSYISCGPEGELYSPDGVNNDNRLIQSDPPARAVFIWYPKGSPVPQQRPLFIPDMASPSALECFLATPKNRDLKITCDTADHDEQTIRIGLYDKAGHCVRRTYLQEPVDASTMKDHESAGIGTQANHLSTRVFTTLNSMTAPLTVLGSLMFPQKAETRPAPVAANTITISTVEQFLEILNRETCTGYFILGSDLDFAGINLPENGTRRFQGILDGKQHAILNLKTSHSLFGEIGENCEISNLALRNCTLTTRNRIGGILADRTRGSLFDFIHLDNININIVCALPDTDSPTPEKRSYAGLVGEDSHSTFRYMRITGNNAINIVLEHSGKTGLPASAPLPVEGKPYGFNLGMIAGLTHSSTVDIAHVNQTLQVNSQTALPHTCYGGVVGASTGENNENNLFNNTILQANMKAIQTECGQKSSNGTYSMGLVTGCSKHTRFANIYLEATLDCPTDTMDFGGITGESNGDHFQYNLVAALNIRGNLNASDRADPWIGRVTDLPDNSGTNFVNKDAVNFNVLTNNLRSAAYQDFQLQAKNCHEKVLYGLNDNWCSNWKFNDHDKFPDDYEGDFPRPEQACPLLQIGHYKHDCFASGRDQQADIECPAAPCHPEPVTPAATTVPTTTTTEHRRQEEEKTTTSTPQPPSNTTETITQSNTTTSTPQTPRRMKPEIKTTTQRPASTTSQNMTQPTITDGNIVAPGKESTTRSSRQSTSTTRQMNTTHTTTGFTPVKTSPGTTPSAATAVNDRVPPRTMYPPVQTTTPREPVKPSLPTTPGPSTTNNWVKDLEIVWIVVPCALVIAGIATCYCWSNRRAQSRHRGEIIRLTGEINAIRQQDQERHREEIRRLTGEINEIRQQEQERHRAEIRRLTSLSDLQQQSLLSLISSQATLFTEATSLRSSQSVHSFLQGELSGADISTITRPRDLQQRPISMRLASELGTASISSRAPLLSISEGAMEDPGASATEATPQTELLPGGTMETDV